MRVLLFGSMCRATAATVGFDTPTKVRRPGDSRQSLPRAERLLRILARASRTIEANHQKGGWPRQSVQRVSVNRELTTPPRSVAHRVLERVAQLRVVGRRIARIAAPPLRPH